MTSTSSEPRNSEDFAGWARACRSRTEGDDSMDALFRATDAAIGVRGKVTGFRISLATITTWRRHESQSLRGPKVRGRARARMRRGGGQRLPARGRCILSDQIQEPARVNRCETSPRIFHTWPENFAEMSKTASPTSVTSSVTSNPQRGDDARVLRTLIMARKNARGAN